ncbi:MAG: ATP-binding cassette domain-containing protein [Spirochaetales bacterium]|nr:ATP-binding cassette domain-containing protein [Spirochaetales bacterium]
MNILSIENLEKTLKDEPLFENVTLGLESGEKVGIVGKNGCGKSTFLKTISGEITPDEGKISLRSGTNMVMLEQNVTYPEGCTVMDYLYLSKDKNIETLKEYHKALGNGDERAYTALGEKIEKENLWDIERSFLASITDMGEDFSPESRMDSLSGGEQKKVAIARAFALRPGLLLLDEPTNHLDIKSVEYIESWIKATSISVIIVTHDRHILNECCSTIWELDRKHFYRHPGSFSAYLERKEERIVMNEKEQQRLQTILRRELKWLIRGPQARTGKDKNRKDRIEEMQSSLEKVRDDKMTEFSSLERRLGKKILDLTNIRKSYDDRTLFSDFTFSFTKGMKIGLVGDNGSGKSTLLDIMDGRTLPDSGSVDKGVNTVFGYYDQLGRNLESKKTVLDYALDYGERVRYSKGEDVTTARFLEIFGFPSSMHRTPIELLSGGERRRLYLITRLISNPNFLLLDEPTNDIDIETMENLEEYISSFPGCAVISSHDRTFLDCTVDMLFVIENEKVTLFPGNYTQWKEEKERIEAEKKSAEIVKEKEKTERHNREKKGLSYKEEREKEQLEKEIEEIEAIIGKLEESFVTAEKTELGTLQERTKLYEDNKILLDEKTERWLELEEKASN